jgi:hypothetical protein
VVFHRPEHSVRDRLRGFVLNAADVEADAVLAPLPDGRSHLEVLADEAETVLVTFNQSDIALTIAPLFDSFRKAHRLGRSGVLKTGLFCLLCPECVFCLDSFRSESVFVSDGKTVPNIPGNVVSMDCSGFGSKFDTVSMHNYHLTRDYRLSLELYYRDVLLSFLRPSISKAEAKAGASFGDASPVIAAIVDVIEKKFPTKG